MANRRGRDMVDPFAVRRPRSIWPPILVVLIVLLASCKDNKADPAATVEAGSTVEITPESTSEESTTSELTTSELTTSELTTSELTTSEAMTAESQMPAEESTTQTATTVEPAFTPAKCQFNFLSGRDVECGYLVVPEKHAQSDNGRTLRLHVAIFRSDSPDPASDPVVYLAGGPGAHALEAAQYEFETTFAPLLADRDLVMFDQRGTGYSEPSLDCPEMIEATYQTLALDLSPEEFVEKNNVALFQCRDRLLEEGVDLTAYNSTESSADVNALRQALGYDEWNLYGISYGTRLAQTVMRDHPDGIRSVVIDSVYPIAANMYTDMPVNMWNAMELFFSTCESDPVCVDAYPDLRQSFFDLVDQLDSEPILVSVPHVFTGARNDTLVDGSALLVLLFQSLYHAELTSLFPTMIEEILQGDLDLLTGYLAQWLVQIEFISTGMQISVQCHEEAAFADTVAVAEAAATYPELEAFFFHSSTAGIQGLDFCERWESGKADAIEDMPVSSDLPTLIITGEHDPVTPPLWGREVAQGLSNHFFLEFPGVGHGASLSNECPRSVVLAYLNDPGTEPDSSCIADMSFDFVTPFVPSQVLFEPTTIDRFDISAITPAGWIRADDEYFVSPDRTIELVIKENRDQTIEAFWDDWGSGEVFDELVVVELVWLISEVSIDGVEAGGYFATSPTAEGFFMVLLVTSIDQPASLYEPVFMPMVQAFQLESDVVPQFHRRFYETREMSPVGNWLLLLSWSELVKPAKIRQ